MVLATSLTSSIGRESSDRCPRKEQNSAPDIINDYAAPTLLRHPPRSAGEIFIPVRFHSDTYVVMPSYAQLLRVFRGEAPGKWFLIWRYETELIQRESMVDKFQSTSSGVDTFVGTPALRPAYGLTVESIGSGICETNKLKHKRVRLKTEESCKSTSVAARKLIPFTPIKDLGYASWNVTSRDHEHNPNRHCSGTVPTLVAPVGRGPLLRCSAAQHWKSYYPLDNTRKGLLDSVPGWEAQFREPRKSKCRIGGLNLVACGHN